MRNLRSHWPIAAVLVVLEFLVPEFRISLIPNEIPILCEIRDSRPERETHGEADKC
jgi:hypothetical protein